MLKKSPENVWVQAVRMKENEEDMEQFYKYWKERTNNVIIQKYDWCCGKLPQRKVTDLSPVKRLPCWHLKREMIILTDGSVPVCRDDLEKEMVLGNILTDKIETIWQNGQQYYRQHLSEEYPELCRNCDEYYTYNY
jgi:spiro-SPASM protein